MAINSFQSGASPIERLGALLGVVKAGKEVYDQFDQSAKRSALESKFKDPKSAESADARQLVGQVSGTPVGDTVSRYQLENKYGPLAKVAELGLSKNIDLATKAKEIGLQGEENRKTKAFEEAHAKPSDTQTNAAMYAQRIQQAENVFNDLNKSGYDPSSITASVQGSGIFPEAFKTEEAKKQQQAQANFVNAVLRRESGAAISASEFESAAKQYFPQAGDTPEILQQKKENRALELSGLTAAAGKAIKNVSTPNQISIASSPKGLGGSGHGGEAFAGSKAPLKTVKNADGSTSIFVKSSKGWVEQ